MRKKKELKILLQINSDCGYMRNYCSKMVYLHIFTSTDVGAFWAKMLIYDPFFYFRLADVSALMGSNFHTSHYRFIISP